MLSRSSVRFKSTLGARLKEAYTNAMGYRQKGLLKDDLFISETDEMQEALRRLPRREFYDRTFRIRRALNLGANNETLEESEWTKPEEDTPYLQPILARIRNEQDNMRAFDQLVDVPQQLKARNRIV